MADVIKKTKKIIAGELNAKKALKQKMFHSPFKLAWFLLLYPRIAKASNKVDNHKKLQEQR